MEIQLSHLQAVRSLACEITDFLFFLSILLTLSVFVLPHCYCIPLRPNEMSFLYLFHLNVLKEVSPHYIIRWFCSIFPASSLCPVFFTAEISLKMSRGLITLTLLHEPVSLKPIPSQLRSLRLCHSSFTRKREAPSVLTWPNTDSALQCSFLFHAFLLCFYLFSHEWIYYAVKWYWSPSWFFFYITQRK